MRESQRLGRGLASLLGNEPQAMSVDSAALIRVAVGHLVPNPFQPRALIEPESLSLLVESVREHGVLQPLLVREILTGGFQIIAGERRWRAAQQAGLKDVPCIVVSMSDREASMAALVENLQREDLNALDEAEGFRQLIEQFSVSHDVLARAVGKSRSHIANTLRLLALPEPVRDSLRRGDITAGHARALLTQVDPTAAARLVIQQGLNVRQTEALVLPSATTAAEPRPEDRVENSDLLALERDLSGQLGLSVRIIAKGRGGRLTISYRNLDQLDGLIALLSRSVQRD